MSQKFDPDFYITCATVIPVLFLAAAAQGASYDVIMGAWQKVQRTSLEATQAAIQAFRAVLNVAEQAGQDVQQAAQEAQAKVQAAGEAEQAVQATVPLRPWIFLRGIGATIASPILQFVAALIVAAGGAGEGLALYVLYRGSEQPAQRKLVLGATLVLLAAVIASPLLTYARRTRCHRAAVPACGGCSDRCRPRSSPGR